MTTPLPVNLNDKVAAITGGSSGIGMAVARELHGAGMRVAICARRQDRMQKLVDELGSDRVLALPADMRSESDIASFFDRVRTHWGGVYALVNNAGLGKATSLIAGDADNWREMLEVNVLGLSIATREALKDMMAANAGHIVHISSMAAHRTPAGSGMYSATKYAVRSLTEGLRLELRREQSAVRVTSISPGFVETEFAEVFHGDRERAEETYNQFKVLDAQDIARAVAFVLSQPAHVQVHDMLMRPTNQAQ